LFNEYGLIVLLPPDKIKIKKTGCEFAPSAQARSLSKEYLEEIRRIADCLTQARKFAQKNRTLTSTADLPESFASEGAVFTGSSLDIQAAFHS
jgi:hypothetical protein